MGLDIGSSALKAVRLRKKDGRLIAEQAGIAPMPGGAFSRGIFLDPPAVSECIRKFWRDQRLSGDRVAVGVAGEDVIHTRQRLTRADDESLRAQVREQTARLIPFPLEQANLDFQILDNFSVARWVEALVVAVKREKVERLRDVLERAGKTPVIVDSTAYALANAFQTSYEPLLSEIAVLVHLGTGTMTVVIVRGSTPILAQDFSLVQAQFSEEEYSLTDRIAVQLERMFERMDEIADERPLEPRSRQIARLLISGGGARLPGLEKMLRTRVKLPFEELNPFRKIEFRSVDALGRLVLEYMPSMTVAVGLAMRGLES